MNGCPACGGGPIWPEGLSYPPIWRCWSCGNRFAFGLTMRSNASPDEVLDTLLRAMEAAAAAMRETMRQAEREAERMHEVSLPPLDAAGMAEAADTWLRERRG